LGACPTAAQEKCGEHGKGGSGFFHGGVLLEVRAFCAFIDTDAAATRFVRIL